MLRHAAFLLTAWSSVRSASAYEANANIPNVLPKGQFLEFVTRPDILVPKWNVTTYEPELLSPGFWFTAFYEQLGPMATTKHYIGPQIYDDHGELVWSSIDLFHNADSFDFRVTNLNGEEQLSFLSLYAQSAVVLNHHYDVVKRFPIGKFGSSANMHDFNIVDNGTRALVLHRNVTRADETMSDEIGYDGQCLVNSHYIEESDTSDPDHWQKIFKWHALDHLRLNESSYERNDTKVGCNNRWDYLHANAIDKCPDGDLLLSARNTDTIYKISHDDGRVVWRLGGYESDFQKNFVFSRQHHVRCHESNSTNMLITFLDNANTEDPNQPTNPYSRGLKVALDLTEMRAEIIRQYPHPEKKIQAARGSCELLNNGNVFMGWSDRSTISEHTEDGRIIQWAHILPTWMRAYRSYKFTFVGSPKATPDVVSRVEPGKQTVSTQVFVSWNGATEVAYWNLYKSDKYGNNTMLVASMPRNGFETQLVYDGLASYVVVEALDIRGQLLPRGRTSVIKTQLINKHNVPAADFAKAKTEETKWLQGVAFDKDHPWLAKAKSTTTSPWGMFVAGIFATIGVFAGVWLALRIVPRRTTWWKQRSYSPLQDQDSNEMEKPTFKYESVGDSNASSSSLREASLESLRKG